MPEKLDSATITTRGTAGYCDPINGLLLTSHRNVASVALLLQVLAAAIIPVLELIHRLISPPRKS